MTCGLPWSPQALLQQRRVDALRQNYVQPLTHSFPLPHLPAAANAVPTPHSASFTGPTPGLTGPSGFPRSPAVFRGRPHRASCPGRPRMDILSIRPLDSRSARRWAKGSRSRKRRRVAPERLIGGTGMSRQARRGRMPLRAVVTAQAMEGERLRRRRKSAPGMPQRVRPATRVAPRAQRVGPQCPGTDALGPPSSNWAYVYVFMAVGENRLGTKSWDQIAMGALMAGWHW
jgi:hypothetical protein